MTITVRRAVLADAEAVREVGHKVWPVAYAGIASPSFLTDGLAQWWSPVAVERGITRGLTLVALDGEAVVGMAGLGREGEHWVMWKLYILPEYQGRGLGRQLVASAVEALPDGTQRLLLDVLTANTRAIGFYERLGFVRTEDGTGRDLGPDLSWMSLELKPA